jgi:putative DNA methylase
MKIEVENFNPVQDIRPVRALAHTAPYKIHKYFARRPWNVFQNMIRAVSEEGDIVLDPFCGGGVTIYESFRLGRRAVGFDVNPLSIWIVKNMLINLKNVSALKQAVRNCLRYLHDLYSLDDHLKFDWMELSYLVICPSCGVQNRLLNDNKVSNGVYRCSNPQCDTNSQTKFGFHTKDAQRIGYDYLYGVNFKNGVKTVHDLSKKDLGIIRAHIDTLKSECNRLNIIVHKTKIPELWDRQFEDQLSKKGILYFEDLFTERNFLINLLLKHKIDCLKEELGLDSDSYSLLKMIHSNVLKETNNMSFTVDKWQGGKPTTWSKHAYWLPNQFCEVCLLSVWRPSVQRILSSLQFNSENLKDNCQTGDSEMLEGDVNLFNQSIAHSKLKENSVDAIVTDPPYGSNVQYLELSHFWYPWNKDLYQGEPKFSEEAISNRKKFEGSKDMYNYEENLLSVFSRSFKVLKRGRYMSLTFNNKDISAWLALLISIFKSGFQFVPNGLIFQDGVENYKHTSHTKFEGSPYGDFIYIFQKPEDQSEKPFAQFSDEKTFINELDSLFQNHLTENKDSPQDRNHLKRSMFIEAIPLIENYAKSVLIHNPNHGLYNHFTKTYLKKLYQK